MLKKRWKTGCGTASGEFFVTVNDELVRVYEGENADEANKVALGKMESSGGIEWVDFVKLPSDLNIGDYVTYSPSGTYNWQAKYASSDLADDGSADVMLASGTAVTDQNQDMSITSWRVLSINEITGEVELVPAQSTSNGVRLHGAQGYNNGVKLLNDACSNLYGDSSKGISARSINIEDIESRMTKEALEEAHEYISVNTKWGEQSKVTSGKNYPTIYAKEKWGVIQEIKNEDGLGESEQYDLIDRNDEGATGGMLTARTALKHYQTYWFKNNDFMQTAFKGEEYELLMPLDKFPTYWIATRSMDTHWGFSCYGIKCLSGGNMSHGTTSYDGDGDSAREVFRSLFPITSLNVNLISGNDTDGWKIE